MENIGYEEFPKLSNDDAGPVEGGGESGCVADEDYTSSHLPPVYTPSAAAPIAYPQEPPPAYSQHLPSSSFPQLYNFTADNSDSIGQGHFGAFIDHPSVLPPPVVVTDPPADYLAQSIFNLIFCCIIFGAVALFKSINVRSSVQIGNYEQAYVHSIEARNWNIAAAVTGGVLWAMAILSLIVMYTV